MPQVPAVGNFLEEDFDRIWNGDAYRAMRRRVVMGDPIDACRGCTHLQEISDPARIAALLGGRSIPRREDEPPLPATLETPRLRPAPKNPPPVLRWDAVPGARHYVVVFSLDRASVLFSTETDPSPTVHASPYVVPGWAWRLAPLGREIYYRVTARIPGEPDRIVLEGTVTPE